MDTHDQQYPGFTPEQVETLYAALAAVSREMSSLDARISRIENTLRQCLVSIIANGIPLHPPSSSPDPPVLDNPSFN